MKRANYQISKLVGPKSDRKIESRTLRTGSLDDGSLTAMVANADNALMNFNNDDNVQCI